MTAAGWIEIALYVAILTALTPVLGAYLTRVYRGEVGIAALDRLTVRVTSRTGSATRGRSWSPAPSSSDCCT